MGPRLLSIQMSEMTSKFFLTFQYHIVLSQYYQISPDSLKYQSSQPKLPEAHCCSTAVGCNHSWSSTRPPSTKSSRTSARRQHGRYQQQQRQHLHQSLPRMIKRLGGAMANKAVQGGGEIVRRISRYVFDSRSAGIQRNLDLLQCAKSFNWFDFPGPQVWLTSEVKKQKKSTGWCQQPTSRKHPKQSYSSFLVLF